MSALPQREAAEIREEWLGRLLSTSPADRPAAEAAISELYRLIGLDPPRFHWVSSPVAALTTVPPGLRPRRCEAIENLPEWPVPSRINQVRARLRHDLEERFRWADRSTYRLIYRSVQLSLRQSSNRALDLALGAAYDSQDYFRSPWHDLQDVSGRPL